MGDARLELTLNGQPAAVRVNVRELPVLRTVTLTDGDTGELALMAIPNPSFVDAGALPGEAERWTLSAVTDLEEIGGLRRRARRGVGGL